LVVLQMRGMAIVESVGIKRWGSAAVASVALVILMQGPSMAQATAPVVAPASTLQGLASLISAVAWPVIVVVLLLRHGRDLGGVFSSLKSFEIFGIRAELQKAQADAALEASARPKDEGPTQKEVVRAEQLNDRIDPKDLDEVRQQALLLAIAYGDERSGRPPGAERTRTLELVVARMRVIGLAAFPFRYALAASATPGERLMAIVCLQMRPDFDMLNWLAARVNEEKAFIAYHALVALSRAADHALASSFRPDLAVAIRLATPTGADVEIRMQHQRLLDGLGEAK
jgi:hypothetical protein